MLPRLYLLGDPIPRLAYKELNQSSGLLVATSEHFDRLHFAQIGGSRFCRLGTRLHGL
jgi:hypothetical protein